MEYKKKNKSGNLDVLYLNMFRKIMERQKKHNRMLVQVVKQQHTLISLLTTMQVGPQHRDKEKNENFITEKDNQYSFNGISITKEKFLAILRKSTKHGAVTHAAYAIFGEEELSESVVRKMKDVDKKPLCSRKKEAVKMIYEMWLKEKSFSDDEIQMSLSNVQFNKLCNGAITAARKKITYNANIG